MRAKNSKAKIKIKGAGITIKETHQNIQYLSAMLKISDKFDIKQKDINNIYNYIEKISHLSYSIQEEVEKFKKYSRDRKIILSQKERLYYKTKQGFNFFETGSYITAILESHDEAINILSKYSHLARTDRRGSILNEANDNENMEDIIKRLGEKISRLATNKDSLKKDDEENLNTNIEIKKEHERLVEYIRKEGEEITASVIITELSKKSERSEKELKLATCIHMGVLAGFFLYSFILIFIPAEWSGLPKLGTEPLEYIGIRGLLFSPAVLVIVFSSKYYNRVFRRNEYFASKNIIASLIEGFKREATDEEYKNAIAATVFSELLLDPADYLDRMEKRKKEKESVIASLIDKIKNKAVEAAKEELETTAKKPTPPE